MEDDKSQISVQIISYTSQSVSQTYVPQTNQHLFRGFYNFENYSSFSPSFSLFLLITLLYSYTLSFPCIFHICIHGNLGLTSLYNSQNSSMICMCWLPWIYRFGYQFQLAPSSTANFRSCVTCLLIPGQSGLWQQCIDFILIASTVLDSTSGQNLPIYLSESKNELGKDPLF